MPATRWEKLGRAGSNPAWAGVLITVLYLVWGGLSSGLAPYGWWTNRVFGSALWLEADPGYWYMTGSHEALLRPRDNAAFAGHPGVPLRVILHAVQRASYWVGSYGSGVVDYSAFTARRLSSVFAVAKVTMTLLQLVSFYLLFRFCKRLTCSDRAATIATLVYASSWPVLFYTSRVSVEPLSVICFLATFLSAWKCREVLQQGTVSRAASYSCVAAVAAVSGFFTKLHFHFALPVWVVPTMLLVPSTRRELAPARGARRLVAATYLGSALALGVAYSAMVDWQEFRRLWVLAANVPGQATSIASTSSDGQLVVRIGLMASAMKQAYQDGFVAKVLSGPTGYGIFLYCEWGLCLLAAMGGMDFLLRHRAQRWRMVSLVSYSLLPMPVIAYRILLNPTSFHYFFLPLVVASVLTGHILDRALSVLRPTGGPWFERAAVLTCVVLLHIGSIRAAVDSKAADVRMYNRDWRPISLALQRVGPAQRVGVVTERSPHPYRDVIAHTMFEWMSSRRVPLTIAVRDSLVFASHLGRDRSEVTEDLRRQDVSVVVDLRRGSADRGPMTLAEFERSAP